ncbi:hypothetical protein C5167_008497 [Papaver somniferum]|uniref:Chaperone DnaJ C-terminal domain-containing protein n=1 Tax=Papaver somniferum TaxID=3469 RepID=A0A4Y7JW55_PAPSO|nr:hypothetical protein C5167_008497 [Papaver somniferum]
MVSNLFNSANAKSLRVPSPDKGRGRRVAVQFDANRPVFLSDLFLKDFTLLVGDRYRTNHKVLRNWIDSGKTLPSPDGLLLNSQVILGGTVQVPTLTGDVVLKVPSGTQPGQKVVLKREG